MPNRLIGEVHKSFSIEKFYRLARRRRYCHLDEGAGTVQIASFMLECSESLKVLSGTDALAV